jgi:hypothetical protein
MCAGLSVHDSKIERSRNDHPAEGAGERQRRSAQVLQLT